MIDYNDPKREEYVRNVLKIVSEKKLKFARLQFIDINGIVKSFAISTRYVEDALQNGQAFDGSSVTGFGQIEESDMIVIPDPSTFNIIPWRREEVSTCRMICDVYTPEMKRFEGDPRYILYKAVKKAEEMGYKYFCAPELEFFIMRPTDDLAKPKPIDLRGYFDLNPGGETEDLRREICDTAEQFGINIEVSHHEVAMGQNEIDFRYGEALETADRTVTMKTIIKTVAAQRGYIATFMPKPFFGVNGSGMHVHQSLWSLKGENLFYDERSKLNLLSDTALHFIAGQLKYGREMCAVLASWPNSYKRLLPGYEAPVYVAWGFKNRSPLIRVPNFSNKPSAARIEIRCPDPAGNPYLQLAVLLQAGLEGIKNKLQPPEPTDLNVYKLTFEERKKLGIVSLPETLGEALNEFENSAFMKEALGSVAFTNFLSVKRKEWDEYKSSISEWEIERYLTRL
ncbi:MAG: glutamine synthetase family protein [Candidatus Odinarchaeum yellowstonii]|jgi:glutamine synthetase|uniref:Glutamine synthetase n=1 Tax=Odinarchaeota yellowstonii (strain LCB_4) TaxID=1841599 RepID=A0AAF0IBT0_ODILC|nr:MAG: glutamine synthetase family protein [Candidatus Odinarchaeum yellowstonii]